VANASSAHWCISDIDSRIGRFDRPDAGGSNEITCRQSPFAEKTLNDFKAHTHRSR
jgi:hypothetical protein